MEKGLLACVDGGGGRKDSGGNNQQTIGAEMNIHGEDIHEADKMKGHKKLLRRYTKRAPKLSLFFLIKS